MPAYIIVDVLINDAEKYEGYKKLTPASLIPFEGTFVVRGGVVDTLEGDWLPQRIVIIKFPGARQARNWWNSSGYAPAKLIRQSAADTKMILVEGLDL